MEIEIALFQARKIICSILPENKIRCAKSDNSKGRELLRSFYELFCARCIQIVSMNEVRGIKKGLDNEAMVLATACAVPGLAVGMQIYCRSQDPERTTDLPDELLLAFFRLLELKEQHEDWYRHSRRICGPPFKCEISHCTLDAPTHATCAACRKACHYKCSYLRVRKSALPKDYDDQLDNFCSEKCYAKFNHGHDLDLDLEEEFPSDLVESEDIL